jgi:hypothetical protein
MAIDKDELYCGFPFENGYIHLINDLIKIGILTNIFSRHDSLILLKSSSHITYYIKEKDFMDLYKDLKKFIVKDNMSPNLKKGVISLKKWIERAYHNFEGVSSYESLMSFSKDYFEIIHVDSNLIDYPQITDSYIRWTQDEYSYMHLEF